MQYKGPGVQLGETLLADQRALIAEAGEKHKKQHPHHPDQTNQNKTLVRYVHSFVYSPYQQKWLHR